MAYQFKFSESGLAPYARFKGESYYRIHGVDRHVSGSLQLFFASSHDESKTIGSTGVDLEPSRWFGGGTFRNSLYLEPIRQLTTIRDLAIVVEYQGAIRLKVSSASQVRGAEVIANVKLHSHDRTRYVLNLGSIGDLPEDTRLFWHFEGLGNGVVHDVVWCTTNTPDPACRMVVTLRTFGRTADLKNLLKRFATAAVEDPFYASILTQMEFWVLDTTKGSEKSYQEPWFDRLNLRVLHGPNLGGGGNASHLLHLLREAAAEAGGLPPTEVLILDDDLSVSIESLARYFMTCCYRATEHITSAPVLMKSRPTVVWEDGGYWGRLNVHENGDFTQRRNLFPNLIKHGMQMTSFDKVDNFLTLNVCEYATFIFYGLSMKTLNKLGLPAAFFLRGDDIEFSLRANQAGILLHTNPNIAAWHEPAHSYGQEYMAILHGAIVNLTYGEHDHEFYCRFFEERLHEHASIDDLVGVRLYMDALAELLDPDSKVLTPVFQEHYITKLAELGRARMSRLPDGDRSDFDRKLKESRTLVVPFVYPGFHKDPTRYNTVLVQNHSMRTYRVVPRSGAGERVALQQRYLALVARLASEFDAVRARWQQRLADASTDAFWAAIAKTYQDQTRELYAGRTVLDGDFLESDLPISDDARPAGAVSSVASDVAAYDAFVSSLPTAAVREGVGADSLDDRSPYERMGIGELPADFDPNEYVRINQDVKEAGVDPVEHYLRFGRLEQRRYRA